MDLDRMAAEIASARARLAVESGKRNSLLDSKFVRSQLNKADHWLRIARQDAERADQNLRTAMARFSEIEEGK